MYLNRVKLSTDNTKNKLYYYNMITYDRCISVDDGLLTGEAAVGTNGVLRSETAVDAVSVARLAQTVACVLAGGTERDTEGTVSHVATVRAVPGTRALAGAVTLEVTRHAQLVCSLVHPKHTNLRLG